MLYNVFGHFGNKNFPLGRFRPQSQNNQINMKPTKKRSLLQGLRSAFSCGDRQSREGTRAL